MQKFALAIAPGRRVWIVLLGSATLALVLALAACGGDGTAGAATASSTSSSTAGSSTNSGSAAGSTGASGSTGSAGSTGSTGSTGGGSGSSGSGGSSSTSAKSVTLNWEAPTVNSNGSTLTNLAGYKIHYGSASKDYSQVVALNNPSLSRYVMDSLPSGTYYFAISAYNSQGVESSMSGEVETTVD